MDAAKILISELNRRGIRLVSDDYGLTVEPASRLTDTDRTNIRRLKAGLIALLRYEQSEIQVSPHVSIVVNENPEFGLCAVCGDSAALIIPVAVNGARRFCGIDCYRRMKNTA